MTGAAQYKNNNIFKSREKHMKFMHQCTIHHSNLLFLFVHLLMYPKITER